METESKYLKKIRDVLRKKNSGSSSGTIYSGPNTKAKYLNDIAKEVDKLDISGGGSSESPFFFITTKTLHTPDGDKDVMVQNVADVETAITAGKIIYLKQGTGLIPFTLNGQDNFIFMTSNVTADKFPSQDPEDDSQAIVIQKTTYSISKNPTDPTVSISSITYYGKVEDLVIVRTV